MNNMYSSIFGETPSTQQARQARDSAFQAMLNTRKQTAEKQRTDDVKMARWNALGNLLTTMVQPVGWAIGGSTGGVQKYDDRQYLNAFNRAVKAADDIRNIGNAEEEYKFKLADEEYRRQLGLEDEERRRRQANEDYERKRQIAMEEEEAKENARMERLQQEYELRQKLAETQNAGRIAVANARAANKNTAKKEDKKTTFNVPGTNGSQAAGGSPAVTNPKDERLER